MKKTALTNLADGIFILAFRPSTVHGLSLTLSPFT